MKKLTWMSLLMLVLGAAAVTGYAYTSSRRVAIDAPQGASAAAVGTWLEQDVAVPAGTEVSVVLQTGLDTKSTRAGDPFTARVETPIVINGDVAIPQGAFVTGHVTLAEGAGRDGDAGRMQLAFDAVSYGGRWYAIDSEGPLYEGGSEPDKDAALAESGADEGGVSDGEVGGTTTGAAKGALVGGADDIAASLNPHGAQLVLPVGGTVRFTLARELSVTPVRTPA